MSNAFTAPLARPDGPGLAAWPKRVLAALVDVVLLVPFYVVAGFAGGMLAEGTSAGQRPAAALTVMTLLYLAMLGLGFYNHVVRQGRTGWTWGKQLLGIRLVRESNDQPLGVGITFLRDVAHVFDALPCWFGFLWPLFDRRRQCFADKLVGSLVVEGPKPARDALA